MNISFAKLMLAALFSTFFVGSMTNAVQAEAECITVDKVKSKGGWDIVTQTPVFEPYWFADENGNFQGMDYDLLVEVNKILDIPGTRYTTVPWAGVLPALQTGKSDFVPEAIAVTKARQETFAFAYPEGDNSIMILTRPDTGIKSVEDLPGRTVGIQTGSAGETTLIKLSDDYKAAGKEPVAVKNYQHNVDVFIDLGNRRIDALMMNLAPISSYMKKYPGKFHNAGLASDHLYAAWVFRKEDMGKPGCIGTEVNKALYELREKGTIKELQLKWFGHEMKLPDYDTWVSVE